MEATAPLPKHVEKLKQENVLKRTSAPCAMEWSIDLEKSLRSKKPGQALGAILHSMQRLELWDREPAVNNAQSNIFKLVQGEDRLFATSILLRLVDAFSSGDMQIKVLVVKVFLSLRRNRRRKCKQSDGILFKCSLENRLEILRRVKVVFDAGDVQSSALALVLFGCLADVAKDNADIRYLVLSSLVSADLIQVEASLFAGGCFAELSNDFGLVFLEILVNLATLSEASTVRVIVARAFASIKSSSSNACKSFKAGLKLVLGSSEEEFVIVMLMALSRLAITSSLLIPEQVSLLFSFLTQEKPLGYRVVALKCLYYVAIRGIYNFPAHPLSVQTLVYMLDESDSPPALQCGALQILRKIFLYNLRTDACGDMLELSKLFKILQNAAQSFIMPKRHIALRCLVDILGELLVSYETALDGVDLTMLASGAVSLISDEVGLLVKLATDLPKVDLDMEQKTKTLLSLLFVLFKRCSDLGPLVLEKICLLIEGMVNKHHEVVEMVEGDLTVCQETMGCTLEDDKSFKAKFFICVSKIVSSVLQNLNEAGTISTEVLHRVELMVEQVYKSSSFNCFTQVAFCFSLHSQISNCRVSNESKKNDNLDGYSPSTIQDCLFPNQTFHLECAKTILAAKDSWSAYKLGRYAACQGAWSTAAIIFENLEGTISSFIYKMWFKSLIKFAHSERILQSLKLSKSSNLLSHLEIYTGNLTEACNSLRSSQETMAAMAKSGRAVFFSRWFLDLRLKVVESVTETLKNRALLISAGSIENSRQGENSNLIRLACALSQISSRFSKLAREYDLMATSFMGSDKKNLEIMSENALSCSLLAFSTGFSLFLPRLQNSYLTKRSEDCLQGMLIQDLAWRLQQSDYEINPKFGLLFRFCKPPKNSLLYCANQMPSTSLRASGLLAACNYAVSQVLILQNEANGVHNGDKNLIHVSEKGLQLLWEMIAKWTLIPFRAPNHFFRIRPYISSELFVFNSDTTVCSTAISVLQGSQLTLDMCLQLKNAPVGLQMQSIKLYCILYCKTSFQVLPGTGVKTIGQDWEGDDMVYANDRLFSYVHKSTQKTTDDGVIKTFVRFELNEKGQGFSSCLFNISYLALGSYRTQWLSCCVDKEGNYWSLIPSNVGPIFTIVTNHPER